MAVVLPELFAPTITSTSPESMVKLRLSTAGCDRPG